MKSYRQYWQALFKNHKPEDLVKAWGLNPTNRAEVDCWLTECETLCHIPQTTSNNYHNKALNDLCSSQKT